MATKTPGMTRNQKMSVQQIMVLATAALLGVLYYASFSGSEWLRTKRNSVAFADTKQYFELLTGHHYLECLEHDPPHVLEHRRKTIHHLGYLVFGDAFMRLGGVTGADQISLIWLITPLLGALNFVLAFMLFRRTVGPALAWPGALTYALVPGTWIYAAIPETWTLCGTAVLTVLLLRDGTLPRWWLALVIALFALNNFLLLLLVLLLSDDRLPLRDRIMQLFRIGAVTMVAWLAALTLLGFALSPDFLPHRFLEYTVNFKVRMAENLSVFHPGRWAYNGVNGWLAPFVLNQQHLDFGRTAVFDSARNFPLGTLAVACLGILATGTAWKLCKGAIDGARASGSWINQVTGTGVYLVLVFVASGLAIYYESFLYTQLSLAILVLLMLRSLPPGRAGVLAMWIATAVFALNSAQQVATYRASLGM